MGRLQLSFSLVSERTSVPPETSISQARRVLSRGAAPQRQRRRPAPPPRPRIVDHAPRWRASAVGRSSPRSSPASPGGSLAAPGGLLIAAGRFAGFTGSYLMLIMVLLVARLPWLERPAWPGSARPLAQAGLARGRSASRRPCRPDHARLRPGGRSPGRLRRVVGAGRRSYPDMLAAVAGSGLLGAGRVHLLPDRPAAAAVRDVVGDSSLLLPRARARVRPPDRHRRLLHRPPAGPRPAGPHDLGGDSRDGHRVPGRAAGLAGACATSLRVVEVRDEAPGVVSVVCSGRQFDHLAVSGGQFFLWRFLTRSCGGLLTPTRCRRCRARPTCG